MAQLSRYHPFRYAQTRLFAKTVASLWMSRVGTTLAPDTDDARAVSALVESHYNLIIETLPYAQRPRRLDVLTNEYQMAMTYGAFCAHGRNIFDFTPELLALFSHTDVGDFPLSLLRLPFPIFYLAFGPQSELALAPGQFVDGAYVTEQTLQGKTYLRIELSCAGQTPEDHPHAWLTNPQKRYSLTLAYQEERPLNQLLEDALAKAIRRQQKEAQQYQTALTREAVAETNAHGVTVLGAFHEGSERRREALRANFPVFRQAMNLVVNAISYLCAYPQASELAWPSDAPERLVAQAEQAKTHKAKRKAEAKLLPLGFTRVHFCRWNHAEHSTGAKTSQSRAAPHWRRGHWRNQPCGKGRQDRKLIWIVPVMVGDGCPSLGRIYSVDNDTSNA